MQTNKEMRDKWAKDYEHGDYTLIAKETKPKSTPATIQRIMQGTTPYESKAPTRIVIVINKFYADRKKALTASTK